MPLTDATLRKVPQERHVRFQKRLLPPPCSSQLYALTFEDIALRKFHNSSTPDSAASAADNTILLAGACANNQLKINAYPLERIAEAVRPLPASPLAARRRPRDGKDGNTIKSFQPLREVAFSRRSLLSVQILRPGISDLHSGGCSRSSVCSLQFCLCI